MNECAVQANKQTDEQVAQYFQLGFWLILPTVMFRILVRMVVRVLI